MDVDVEQPIKQEPAEEMEVKKEDLSDSGEYSSSSEEEEDALSHQEMMVRLREGVAELLVGDPLLHTLPTSVTLEEVRSQVALEYGQAMTVHVRRLDGGVLPVVVVQTATVRELKNAIRSHMTLKISREGGPPCISWRYVWKTFCLVYDGQRLTDDNRPVKDYGIRNRDEVTFVKRLRSKAGVS